MRRLSLLLLVSLSVHALAQNRRQLDTALYRTTQMPNDTNQVNSYLNLINNSNRHFELTNDEKRLYGKTVLSISQKLNFKRGIAGGHNTIGLSYLGKKRDAEMAISYFDSARIEYETIGDTRGLGGSLCNLGIVYTTLHLYDRAMDSLLRAKSILEGMHDTLFLANTLCSMGNVYAEQNKYAPSLESLHAASMLYEALEEKRGWALANLRVSWILGKQGKYKEAEIVASPLVQLLYDLSLDKEAMWASAHIRAMQRKGKGAASHPEANGTKI